MNDPAATGTLTSTGAASSLPLLEVNGLTVLLEVNGAKRAVLRDVSLTVRPGETVGLVGESGSGKSMTARAVDRLLPPGAEVQGSIRFGGADVSGLAGADLRRYRSQVAMIFQDPRAHINPVRRVGDFMTEALRTNLGVPRAAARRQAADMLAQVGIEDGARRLGQYPHQMSGGMLQRVMIAAALLTRPRLLLADEPTTALDVSTQAEVIAILDGLRREYGLAMLFITHDLDLAAAICDRTVVMYAGQVVEVRASALLHGDPLHPYTAALAAARPDIAQTARRLRAIPGRPLSAFEAPADECAFAPRCAYARGGLPCRHARPSGAGRRHVTMRPRARTPRSAPGGTRWLRTAAGRSWRSPPTQGVRSVRRGRRRLLQPAARPVARHRGGVGVRKDHHRADDRRSRAIYQRNYQRLRTRPVPAGPVRPRPAPARP